MEATLDAVRRSGLGKNEARRLRRQGQVPAVIYGGNAKGEQPRGEPIAIDPKMLLRILRSDSGVNTLIGLTIAGEDPARVLVKEYQVDPIKHHLLHVDFYRVAMDRAITVTVPIELTGEAKGVKQQGGLVDFVHREVEIECLPGDIPEHIEVDISELLIGQSVRIRDLVRDVRWTAVSEPETLIVHVIAPKIEEVEAPAAEVAAPAGPAEPEVIKRGKAEKPEEEAAEE